MQSTIARTLFALAFVLVTAMVASCSSNNNSTSPTPPVTGPAFSFAFPATGTSNKRVFTTAEIGTWAYHCIPHGGSGMTGTINVVAGTPVDSALVQVGAGNALVFSPNTVTIHAGGYVRWVNVSSFTTHTATRP